MHHNHHYGAGTGYTALPNHNNASNHYDNNVHWRYLVCKCRNFTAVLSETVSQGA